MPQKWKKDVHKYASAKKAQGERSQTRRRQRGKQLNKHKRSKQGLHRCASAHCSVPREEAGGTRVPGYLWAVGHRLLQGGVQGFGRAALLFQVGRLQPDGLLLGKVQQRVLVHSAGSCHRPMVHQALVGVGEEQGNRGGFGQGAGDGVSSGVCTAVDDGEDDRRRARSEKTRQVGLGRCARTHLQSGAKRQGQG